MLKKPVVFVLLLWAFLLPGNSFAFSYISQVDVSTTTNCVNTNIGERLGTGLSGVPTEVWFVDTTGVDSSNATTNVSIVEYSDSGYSVATGHDLAFVGQKLGVSLTQHTFIFESGTTTYSLDVNKYYSLNFNPMFAGTGGKCFGSSNSYSYVGGDVFGTVSNSNFKDLAFNLFFDSIQFVDATSSSYFASLLASSTLESLGGRCSLSSNVFSEALCMSFVYLFVPSQNSLSVFSDLWQSMVVKYPFNYVNSIYLTVTGLQASSTDNMVKYSMNLGSLGLGSTTPIGNLLSNFDYLSTTTVTRYAPSGWISSFKSLVSIVLVLTVIYDILFHVINFFH